MGRKRKTVNEAFLSPFHRRLHKLIGDQTQAEFARKAGMSQGGLHRILSGGEPNRETLIALAKAAGVSVGWLADEEPSSLPPQRGETLVRRLAFQASAGAGALVIQEEPSPLPLPSALITELGLKPENARAMEAQGDSMKPTIEDGDLILVNVADRELRDGKIYVFTIGDEAFLKRLRRERGRAVMVSDNPDFPPEPVPAGEVIRIIGRVVWGGRRL